MLPQICNFTSQFQASLIITIVTLGNWLTKHTNSRLLTSPHSSHTKPGWQVRRHHRDFSQLTQHTYSLKIYLPHIMCTEAIHLHSLYSQSQICHFTTLPKTPHSCYHKFVATLIYPRPLLFSPLTSVNWPTKCANSGFLISSNSSHTQCGWQASCQHQWALNIATVISNTSTDYHTPGLSCLSPLWPSSTDPTNSSTSGFINNTLTSNHFFYQW